MLGKAPIKLVIFDNDGTLMDTEEAYTISHLKTTGHELTWDFKLQLMGKTSREASILTIEKYGLDETPESLTKRRDAIVESFWPHIKLMKGAKELVDELKKRGIKMAIATAAARDQFEKKCVGHKDFVALMDFIVCGDEVKHGKPQPDLFLAALDHFKEYNIKPEEAIVFEDSPLGIKAANNAGMSSVFLPDPHVDVQKYLKINEATPDMILQSLDQFDFSKFEWAQV